MNPTPVPSTLYRQSGVIVPPLIPEFSRAISQSAPRDYRDAVNNQAQLGFRGIEFHKGTSEL
jgi:hypothetical protein